MSTLVQPYSQAPISFGSMGMGFGATTPLDLLNAEATPSSDCFLVSTSTRTSTLSPFSGSSLGSQPPQPTSTSATSFFDDAIEGPPEAPVDSTMPDLDADQAETDLPDTLGSTQPATSRTNGSKARATKAKGNAKSNTRKGTAKPNKASLEPTEATPQADAPKSKPRKRGRPKNNVTEADLEEYPQEDLAEDGLPKDPRRRRVLERNRIAATKCRNRKRDEARDLAFQEQEAENRHRYLSSVCDSLTAQIYELKTQLLCHSDCGCELIQTYIAHEARRSVDTMTGAPPGSDYRASAVASSSGSIQTSPEAETTPAWPSPFPMMPAAATPTTAGFDHGYENFPMVSAPPSQSAVPPPVAIPVAGFNTGMMIPPDAPPQTIMHSAQGKPGFWPVWEGQ